MLPFLQVSQPNQAQRQVSLDKIRTAAFTTPAQKHFSKFRVLKGLIWAEWYAHSKLVLSFLMVWLGAVWVLPVAAHPGWILLLGFFFAFFAGPAFGGGDVVEGCEEFTLALPVTRSERYCARLLIGGGGLLILTALDLLALGIDLSPALARLYLNTGLIKPLPVFCYPNGNCNQDIKDLTRDNGYVAALGCDLGLEGRRPADLFSLKRISLHEDIASSTSLLALTLSGFR